MPPEEELRAAIVQDADSGRVLMLAWMDAEAERRTRATGEAWFWSRSRGEYWHKGATSGNTLAVVELRDDCDGDALLLRVRPAGPACHTGSLSCFAPALWRTVVERVRERPEGSYVASIADAGVERAAQKLGEEAVEAAVAATARDGRLVEEAADVLFHLYVLLAVAGADIADVEAEARGAGEILLTSIDADGTREGYDLEITRAVVDAVSVPVIASGGAGNAHHVAEALAVAQAALLASILHEDPERLTSLRAELRELGVALRDAA